jgi:ribosome-associated heat shock protein Hsp15
MIAICRLSSHEWVGQLACLSWLLQNSRMTGVRIDKWLWASRFFKTRVLASKSCELGRVLLKGQPAKAAREVKVGDRLQVTTEGGEYEIDVLALSEVRGPAAVAQTLYRETEESKAARTKAAEERKANRDYAPAPTGRPSKRDRRRIIQFRGER